MMVKMGPKPEPSGSTGIAMSLLSVRGPLSAAQARTQYNSVRKKWFKEYYLDIGTNFFTLPSLGWTKGIAQSVWNIRQFVPIVHAVADDAEELFLKWVCTTDTVDLVGRVDLGLLPPGVEVRPGICDQRPAWLDSDGTPMFLGPDTAYSILAGANLSVSTVEAFPYGFPRDFSVLATFRMQQNTQGYLLAVYDWDDEEQLTLHVGENLTFALRSDSSNASTVYSAVFTEPFNDGKQVSREMHSTVFVIILYICMFIY
ncbi:hypothetical protein HPB51_024395 [Rhipicephalus microplus]|uniref:Uncharacterized protein n=1 Tax=Rhipicephalus microplus TaxID=6941 RepID=A0A9J6EJM2_RHIMP|nr:hypothetical protein HPB51_024395 [Rhipicephalus microplus]